VGCVVCARGAGAAVASEGAQRLRFRLTPYRAACAVSSCCLPSDPVLALFSVSESTACTASTSHSVSLCLYACGVSALRSLFAVAVLVGRGRVCTFIASLYDTTA
jgi:hypothetical protein